METEKKISEMLDLTKRATTHTHENKSSIKSLKEDLNELKGEFKTLKQTTSKTITSFNEDIDSIKEIKQRLLSEITEFKLLKTTLKNKFAKDLINEFRIELNTHSERLKTDVKSYNDLKQEITIIKNYINETKTEFSKFNNISKEIKETDFRLTNYIKKITQMDKEKLNLMKQVDELQKLIGKERRNRRNY